MTRVPESVKVVLAACLAGLLGAWVGSLVQTDAPLATADAEVQASLPSAEAPERTWRERGGENARVRTARIRVAIATRSGAPIAATLKTATATGTGRTRAWKPESTLDVPSDGAVELLLAPGQWLFEAQAQGASASRVFEVVPDQQADVWLMLDPPREVTVHVTDSEDGRAISSAVALTNFAGSLRTAEFQRFTAAADGTIRLTGIPAASSRVEVLAKGYASNVIDLPPGQREFEVELMAVSAIEGTVRDEDGAPLAGITVTGVDDEAVTDARGHFVVHATAGQHTLSAIERGGRAVSRKLEVEKSKDVTGVELTFGPPVRVTGRVVDDSSGAGLAGVRVAALAESGTELALTTSDADGAFTLDGLEATQLHVRAVSGRGAIAEETRQADDLERPVVLKLAAPAVLIGFVRDDEGKPLAYCPVAVSYPLLPDTAETVSDETGAYRIGDLPPGQAMVEARGPQGVTSGQVQVALLSAAAMRADLTLVRTGSIEGKIDDAQGRPAWVTAFQGASKVVEVLARGRYHLQVPPGEWSVGARLGKGGVAESGRVTVRPGETVQQDVSVTDFTDESADALLKSAVEVGTIGASFDDREGRTVVTFLVTGGPASAAGISEGDQIVAVGTNEVHSSLEAFSLTRGKSGSAVNITVHNTAGTRVASVHRR